MIEEPKIEQYQELIEKALEYAGGTHGYEDIVEGVDRGRYQFWPGVRSVIITELLDFPRKKVGHCFLVAGEMAEVMAMRTWVEEWARREGCEVATIGGRPGWARVLRQSGYTPSSVQLEKRLVEAVNGN